MTTFLGFIGFVIILLIVIPASILAFIQVFKQPIAEIFSLWVQVIDKLLDLYTAIRTGINDLKN
jgi:hypothetical protein